MPADNKCDCPIPWVAVRENPILGRKVTFRLCCLYKKMAQGSPEDMIVEDGEPAEKWESPNSIPDWLLKRMADKQAKGFKMGKP